MSVQIVDVPVYNYLRAGLIKAAYSTTCDAWNIHFVRGHFKNAIDIEIEAMRIVRAWHAMNVTTYCNRYSENFKENLKFGQTHKKLEPVQFIKYLSCVLYNIETDHLGKLMTRQQKDDLELLKQTLEGAKHSFICNLPEYSAAGWSE